MRYSFGFHSPTPVVTRCLIAIIGAYLGFALFGKSHVGRTIYQALMLDPYQTVYSFQLWRLVTYAFLHDMSSPMHVILNALMLYMLGTPLEERFGERRFFIFIMAAIISGGVLVCLSFLIGLTSAPVVGFSAATLGLIVAWGLTFSTQSIYILGILPLSGTQLVYITIGLEILYAVSADSISSAAHFGGIITAFVFVKELYRPRRLKQMWNQRKIRRNLRR
ncbi:MAG TPA: rhomboid family intramembrane serine protease [Myxococcota bacterium]|nr:rhomboid family intramembrane serine protease [Myxococcota bacterium]